MENHSSSGGDTLKVGMGNGNWGNETIARYDDTSGE